MSDDEMFERTPGELAIMGRVLSEWESALDEMFRRIDTAMNRYDWSKEDVVHAMNIYLPYEVVDAFDEYYTEVEDD